MQKDIQLQAWTRPYGSRSFKLPARLGSRQTMVVNVVSFTHRPPLHPQRYTWYSFLLEAELIPRPWWCRKD